VASVSKVASAIVGPRVAGGDKAGLARSALEGGAVIGDHLPADAISGALPGASRCR
jgi:hypothetical protein